MTVTRDAQLIDIAACTQELTRPYVHTQRRVIRQGKREITWIHRVQCPSLLDQLRAALIPGSGSEPGGGSGTPMPVAAGPLDALTHISAAARHHCAQLGLRPGPTTETALHALAGAAAQLAPAQLGHLATAVVSWHRTARTETGWDERPRDLRDPCPHCHAKALQVRPDASAAWCRACGARWDSATVGVLAAMLTGHTA